MDNFLLYATANDERLHLQNIINLYSIQKYQSGVDNLNLYVAISKAREISKFDRFFVERINELYEDNDSIDLKGVFFKENLGRDFSSYRQLFLKTLELSKNSYCFFQNRSARGPFKNNWFNTYVNQFESNDEIALCGNTINMYDISDERIDPHVQSHAFMSSHNRISSIISEFPGINENSRLNIIDKGEIELSRIFINKGLKITSLNESQISVGKTISDEIKEYSNLNKQHKISSDLPYYHSGQIRTKKHLRQKIKIPTLEALRWFYKI